MRHQPTHPLLRLLAAPLASGIVLALTLVVAWASASGTAALLFTTAEGLGAVMLITALSGLLGCAVFGTSLGSQEHASGSGLPLRVARAKIRSRASRVRREAHR
jgi:hypothetical protein